MVLLQIATDTINTVQDSSKADLFFSIEKAILICVILYQVIHTVRVYINIKSLRDIFDDKITVRTGLIEKSILLSKENIEKNIFFDDKKETSSEFKPGKNAVRITITTTRGENNIIERIVAAINKYLFNNYGAALNFSIIKDIIDREVDVADEEISQSIPTPLYLGLAATMIGIIFGLLSFTDQGIDTIDPLIRGVKFAMSASLSGLICTTALSSFFYKKAKKKVLREKNDQMNYLLGELLPELVKTEDSGVTGLKTSLDRFSREASLISDNLSIAIKQTGDNLKTQLATIEKIDKMDMTKVSKTNLELFGKLERNMEAFNRFSEYISVMKEISVNLQDFAQRTVRIDTIADTIHTTLSQSNELTRFLNIHFRKIEETGSAVLKAVDMTDSYFRDALLKLKEETDKRITNLNSSADIAHSQLKEIYNHIADGLNDITSKHINEFQVAYSNAVPNFQKLNHLEILEPIKETLALKTDLLASNSANYSGIIIEILKNIKENLNHKNNQTVQFDKLQHSIDDLNQQISGSKHTKSPVKRLLIALEFVVKISAGIMILLLGGYLIYSYFFTP